MLQRNWHSCKTNAKRRNIPFLLTYEQWLRIWQQSGHLHERGCKRGQYVMARFGDTGPYSVDNVKIILVGDNHAERYFTPEYRKWQSERSARMWDKRHQELVERTRWIEEWEKQAYVR
jgi:hypothetical protein